MHEGEKASEISDKIEIEIDYSKSKKLLVQKKKY